MERVTWKHTTICKFPYYSLHTSHPLLPSPHVHKFILYVCFSIAAKSLQSCPTLCNPIDSSPPGSTVPGILQARTLEWVAISFNGWKWKVKVKLLSRVWLFSDPMDCSPPGSSVHGIFQARIPEWGAIAFPVFLITLLVIRIIIIESHF